MTVGELGRFLQENHLLLAVYRLAIYRHGKLMWKARLENTSGSNTWKGDGKTPASAIADAVQKFEIWLQGRARE